MRKFIDKILSNYPDEIYLAVLFLSFIIGVLFGKTL